MTHNGIQAQFERRRVLRHTKIAARPGARLVQDAPVRPPLLVVVTGMPAAGKTTVAESLSRALALPLLARDKLKERLYDTLGVGDLEWSGRLGDAAFTLLFDLARVLIESGDAVILEANFFRGSEPRFFALPEHRVLQIHCDAPLELLVARYTDRPRHLGHHDAEKVKELPTRFESSAHEPLDLPGQLIRIDTSQRVDVDAIAAQVRGHI
jgi:predicted kinase